MIIYADELFIVNVLSDFMLFCAYTVLYGVKKVYLRIAAASAFGGVFAVLDTVYDLSGVIRIPVLFIMVFIVFGRHRLLMNTLRLMMIIVLIQGITIMTVSAVGADALLVSGTVNVFVRGAELFIIYIFSYPVLLLIKKFIVKNDRIKSVYIECGGKKVCFNALYDSGNLLKYHNIPVMVVQWNAVMDLMNYSSYEEYYQNAEGYVLYKTIGKNGVIPIFKPSTCKIDGDIHNIAIAVVNYGFGNKYKGIVGNTN